MLSREVTSVFSHKKAHPLGPMTSVLLGEWSGKNKKRHSISSLRSFIVSNKKTPGGLSAGALITNFKK